MLSQIYEGWYLMTTASTLWRLPFVEWWTPPCFLWVRLGTRDSLMEPGNPREEQEGVSTTKRHSPAIHRYIQCRSLYLTPDQADSSQLISTLLLWALAVTVRIFPECFTATEFENVMFILLSLNVNFNFSSYLTSQKVKMTQCFTCFKTALGQLQEKRMIPSDSPYSKFV